MLRIGDVYEIFDRFTRPQKPKWHICVCGHRRLFLRINSQALWLPHHLLTVSENAFLDHDSYVELRQLVQFGDQDVEVALRLDRNPLGRLSRAEARSLAETARTAPTLTEEQKDLVWNNLTADDYR